MVALDTASSVTAKGDDIMSDEPKISKLDASIAQYSQYKKTIQEIRVGLNESLAEYDVLKKQANATIEGRKTLVELATNLEQSLTDYFTKIATKADEKDIAENLAQVLKAQSAYTSYLQTFLQTHDSTVKTP